MSAKNVYRLVDRDRQLLAVVAEARCLSGEQVRRLFFRGEADTALRRRMKKLSSGQHALLKPLKWFSREGAKVAWGLTPAGYLEVERFLEAEVEVPRDDIGVEYLDHHVLLSELYVGLVGARVRSLEEKVRAGLKRKQQLGSVYAVARHPAFRWTVVGDRDLPWKQADGAKLVERVLRPDAVLEFPTPRRRVFVESEMGSNTIAATSPSKVSATLAKADRYESFCSLLSGPGSKRTWYAERFPDAWKPEVLFLVRNEVRRRSVAAALEAWRRAHPNAVCTFQVGTVESTLAQLLPLVGGTAAPAVEPVAEPKTDAPAKQGSGLTITREEFKAVHAYFSSVQSELKVRREQARAAQQKVPEYPKTAQLVHDFLSRHRAALAG